VFTGLIRHTGLLRFRKPGRLSVQCSSLIPTLAEGDSVAVNGACLTVARLSSDGFEADLLEETARNTTLGALATGSLLNLEPALQAGDAFGGHFVQGHVDGVISLQQSQETQHGHWWMVFELPEWLAPSVVDRGSIALDGISLTVQELMPSSFAVAVIPKTYNETTLGNIIVGAKVNVEADLIVKSVQQTLARLGRTDIPLDLERLKQMGYGE
jgi:riboflavin synthase